MQSIGQGCDKLFAMGSRRRGGDTKGGAIEKFHVTLLHNPSQHCTVNCDALNVSQIVCDAIQKGHSIEKFQHHPPHYFSSLFHAEICHVTLIDIRSNGCTSFLELRRMASSKNAEHSHVILIKGRAWGLSNMAKSAKIARRSSYEGYSQALKRVVWPPHLESVWDNY